MKQNSALLPILLALGGALTAAPNAQLAADPDLELSLLATGIREGMEMTLSGLISSLERFKVELVRHEAAKGALDQFRP